MALPIFALLVWGATWLLVGGTRGVMIGNLIVTFFQGAQYSRGAAAALLIAALIVVLLIIFRKSLDVGDVYGR